MSWAPGSAPSSLNCREISVISGCWELDMSSGVPLMFPHPLYLRPGLAVTAQFQEAAVPEVHTSTLRRIACVEIPRHSVTLTCMWPIQSFQIQLTSPVPLFLLSPWLCHPSMFLVLLSSRVQNVLKTSLVLLQGEPRNHQCFLALLSPLPTVMTGDKASSSYSVSSSSVTLIYSSVQLCTSESVNSQAAWDQDLNSENRPMFVWNLFTERVSGETALFKCLLQ